MEQLSLQIIRHLNEHMSPDLQIICSRLVLFF